MQVEMSLAEMLMNAIAHGDVHGIQWKRGAIDEKRTFADLNAVIQRRLDNALSVAREAGFREGREHPNSPIKLRAQRDEARALVRRFLDYNCNDSDDRITVDAFAAIARWDEEK